MADDHGAHGGATVTRDHVRDRYAAAAVKVLEGKAERGLLRSTGRRQRWLLRSGRGRGGRGIRARAVLGTRALGVAGRRG